MAPRRLPPAAYLRECFDYDPQTGVLRWKERPRKHFRFEYSWRSHNAVHAGRRCRVNNLDGYITVRIDGRLYLGHRIIWKWMTGKEPPPLVDHRNGKPGDNRWEKLRKATPSQSMMNTRIRNTKNRTSKYKGVYWHLGAWEADIRANGKRHYLGRFKTEIEAAQAYAAMAEQIHGEFSHLARSVKPGPSKSRTAPAQSPDPTPDTSRASRRPVP